MTLRSRDSDDHGQFHYLYLARDGFLSYQKKGGRIMKSSNVGLQMSPSSG